MEWNEDEIGTREAVVIAKERGYERIDKSTITNACVGEMIKDAHKVNRNWRFMPDAFTDWLRDYYKPRKVYENLVCFDCKKCG